uniref:keratin, type I cytoskeletal 19-like isoform X2 n=1 Tax=Myxine glutinosa TaxID=7769 RepID=UPI003590071C
MRIAHYPGRKKRRAGDYKCASGGRRAQFATRFPIKRQQQIPDAAHIMSRSPSLRAAGERSASGCGGTASRSFSATSWRGSSSSTFGTTPGGAAYRGNLMGDLQYVNPKMEMQDLNSRLAEYVDKVRTLEHSNDELELKIKQLLVNRNAATNTDYTHYYDMVKAVQKKLLEKHLENESIVLKIDNAHLAADDFKSKWDTECGVRNSVASDISNLRTLLDEYTLARTELETDVEGQKDELAYIKKSHTEDLSELRSHLETTLNVTEMKGDDLTDVLSNLRSQYETFIDKIRDEAEDNFRKLVSTVSPQDEHQNKALSETKQEQEEIRRTYKILQNDLESLRKTIEPLESEYANTQNRKERELGNFLRLIGRLEGELVTANDERDRHLRTYSALLNEKMRLEQEIATYRRLLEDEMARIMVEVSDYTDGPSHSPNTGTPRGPSPSLTPARAIARSPSPGMKEDRILSPSPSPTGHFVCLDGEYKSDREDDDEQSDLTRKKQVRVITQMIVNDEIVSVKQDVVSGVTKG